MTTLVHAEFHDNVRTQLLWALAASGVTDLRGQPLRGEASFVEATASYFNVRLKLLTPGPRRVHWSKELLARHAKLGSDLQGLLAHVIGVLQSDADPQEYLSEHALEAAFYDDCLSVAKLHHVHLRAPDSTTGELSARRNELLFVWADPGDVYLLDVQDHPALYDPGLLDIVKGNWPNLIPADGIIATGENLTDQERRALRRAHVNTPHEYGDGTASVAPGLGFMSNGLPTRAAFVADDLLNAVTDIEENCRNSADRLRLIIRSETGRDVLVRRLEVEGLLDANAVDVDGDACAPAGFGPIEGAASSSISAHFRAPATAFCPRQAAAPRQTERRSGGARHRSEATRDLRASRGAHRQREHDPVEGHEA